MRILIAEDEAAIARALKVMLEKNKYSVDMVHNGNDALDYIRSADYDALVLDIMMPKMSGLEALKRLRAEKCSVPVLLLTAKSELEDKVTGLDAGADDYLTKPFAMSELLARLRAMTRRSADYAPEELRYGNVTLSRATFEMSTPQGAVRLGNKEFQMMEYMMKNPNMLISTEKFMERIWGCDSDTEINVVWVYISYLRKKLRSIGANVAINAARGAGYSLAVENA